MSCKLDSNCSAAVPEGVNHNHPGGDNDDGDDDDDGDALLFSHLWWWYPRGER